MTEELLTVSQAAMIARITTQSIYLAIKQGKLKAVCVKKRFQILPQDLEAYRLNKYNRDLRKKDGEFVFDIDKGHFSVPQVSKVFGEILGRPYPLQRLYYKIRTGQLKSFRKGAAIVITKEDAISFIMLDQNYPENKDQLKMI